MGWPNVNWLIFEKLNVEREKLDEPPLNKIRSCDYILCMKLSKLRVLLVGGNWEHLEIYVQAFQQVTCSKTYLYFDE